MSRRLSKTVVVGGVLYPAGATVPDDVAEGITAKGVWADADEPADTAPEIGPYEGLSLGKLKAEIDRRNKARGSEAVQLSKQGNKASLIAVLTADDEG